MKQITMSVNGFVVVSVPDNFDGNTDKIPVKLDVWDENEHDDSVVTEVHETEVQKTEIIVTIPYKDQQAAH